MSDQGVIDDRAATEPARKGAIARLAPVLAIAAALAGFFALGLDQYFTIETLRDNREALNARVAANPLLAMGLFLAVYAGAVAISFPGASILTIFGGFLFGLWPGVPLIVVAATLGALIIFFVAKSALGDLFTKRAAGFAARMEEGFREDELSYMFLLRLVPAFPFWGVNIAAGLLDVRVRNYLIGTFFGIIPGSFVYASIGAAAGSAFDAGEDVTLSGILFRPETLLPIAGLAVLAVIPIVLRRFSKRV